MRKKRSEHDHRNFESCVCGEPGCFSYDPMGIGPEKMRAVRLADAVVGPRKVGRKQ
ncbi:hypothetical protein AXJ10_gp79 [Gordonia phage GordTnk2]|uniref:Uncharacterized protein n=1 Tax=Gordonia phage GordTnk2 TaxID=1622192 RepID=A0A0E3T6I9_9CAUD|nr:hypothetical protein AXJ10_gp79 [Gordonia phage GordTnk2]AKC02819.1 hypothetical protein GordTnk2_79 [Gordonia phage GordTnk2]